MGKKDFNYFEAFKNQMRLCEKAARQLDDMVENYDDVINRAEAIHQTEHEADNLLHELMDELNRSFITPIDREDIVALANMLDNITDSIEDVSNLFDILSITAVRPAAKEMSKLILIGCEALYNALEEFPRFKSSKEMNDLIIKVNSVEAQGDKMHHKTIKEIYISEKDAIELIKWKEIFDTMESVLDYCEDVADLISGLIIKNG